MFLYKYYVPTYILIPGKFLVLNKNIVPIIKTDLAIFLCILFIYLLAVRISNFKFQYYFICYILEGFIYHFGIISVDIHMK